VDPASLASFALDFINGWKVEAQADDRMLTLGTVASGWVRTARRSSARSRTSVASKHGRKRDTTKRTKLRIRNPELRY